MILFECEYCQKVFTRKMNLLRHYDRKFKCNHEITVVKLKDEKKEQVIIKPLEESLEQEKEQEKEQVIKESLDEEEPSEQVIEEPLEQQNELEITEKTPYKFNEFTEAYQYLTKLSNIKNKNKFKSERKMRSNLTKGFQIKLKQKKTLKKYIL